MGLIISEKKEKIFMLKPLGAKGIQDGSGRVP